MEDLIILTGSKSDFKLLAEMEVLLKESKIDYKVKVASCHRDLEELYNLLDNL